MDQHQHSITDDLTAQRISLRTSDSAPDRAWRESTGASVFLTTCPQEVRPLPDQDVRHEDDECTEDECAIDVRHFNHLPVPGQGERATILFLTTNAVATLTPSGILAVECDRATVAAIVQDWDVVGWKS